MHPSDTLKKPSWKLPHAGSELANGAVVLDARYDRHNPKYGIVFTMIVDGGYADFITWELSQSGATYLGHYYQLLQDAYDDFLTR